MINIIRCRHDVHARGISLYKRDKRINNFIKLRNSNNMITAFGHKVNITRMLWLNRIDNHFIRVLFQLI
jgi:hypothetical protein